MLERSIEDVLKLLSNGLALRLESRDIVGDRVDARNRAIVFLLVGLHFALARYVEGSRENRALHFVPLDLVGNLNRVARIADELEIDFDELRRVGARRDEDGLLCVDVHVERAADGRRRRRASGN